MNTLNYPIETSFAEMQEVYLDGSAYSHNSPGAEAYEKAIEFSQLAFTSESSKTSEVSLEERYAARLIAMLEFNANHPKLTEASRVAFAESLMLAKSLLKIDE